MAKLRHCIQLIGWIFLPGYWSWWLISVCVYFSFCLQAVCPEGASSWFVHWDPASVHISMSTAWWKSWSYTWWLWSYSLAIMIMIIYCDWYHDQPWWLWWKNSWTCSPRSHLPMFSRVDDEQEPAFHVSRLFRKHCHPPRWRRLPS